MHQYYTLSTKRCNEEFYGLFVKSESGSHIPCDLNMEYTVKEVKWNIKHMGSGQNEEIIKRRTAAIHGLKEISKKFDVGATVIKRYQHHAHITDIGDKLEMLQCIYDIQPFAKVAGRAHSTFKSIKQSVLNKLDDCKLAEWIEKKFDDYVYELGN